MKISEYPQVATVAPGDDFIINQEVGGGEYVTRRGSFQAVINGLVTRDLTWSGAHTFQGSVTLSGFTNSRMVFAGDGGELAAVDELRFTGVNVLITTPHSINGQLVLGSVGNSGGMSFARGSDGLTTGGQIGFVNADDTGPFRVRMSSSGGELMLHSSHGNNNGFVSVHIGNLGRQARWDATGLGLGNITPNFRLDSNGDVRIRSDNRLRLGGTGAADTRGSIFAPSENTLAFHPGSGAGAEALKLEPAVATVSTDLTVNGAVVMMPNLPTENPNVAGQLWNDGGTLKISAGP